MENTIFTFVTLKTFHPSSMVLTFHNACHDHAKHRFHLRFLESLPYRRPALDTSYTYHNHSTRFSDHRYLGCRSADIAAPRLSSHCCTQLSIPSLLLVRRSLFWSLVSDRVLARATNKIEPIHGSIHVQALSASDFVQAIIP